MTERVHDEETYEFLADHMVNEDDFFKSFFDILILVPLLVFWIVKAVWHFIAFWLTEVIEDSPWSRHDRHGGGST